MQIYPSKSFRAMFYQNLILQRPVASWWMGVNFVQNRDMMPRKSGLTFLFAEKFTIDWSSAEAAQQTHTTMCESHLGSMPHGDELEFCNGQIMDSQPWLFLASVASCWNGTDFNVIGSPSNLDSKSVLEKKRSIVVSRAGHRSILRRRKVH